MYLQQPTLWTLTCCWPQTVFQRGISMHKACAHACTNTHTLTCIHCAHTHMNTYRQIQTQTCTHTHTVCSPPQSRKWTSRPWQCCTPPIHSWSLWACVMPWWWAPSPQRWSRPSRWGGWAMGTPSWASRQPAGLQRSGQDSQNTGTVANVRTVRIHAQSHRTNYRHSHWGQDSQTTGTVTKVRTVKIRH